MHVAKSLTGFELHNNSKQHARTCSNMQQGVQTDVTCNMATMMGFFWPKMLRPFARGLKITVIERKSVRIGLYRHEV